MLCGAVKGRKKENSCGRVLSRAGLGSGHTEGEREGEGGGRKRKLPFPRARTKTATKIKKNPLSIGTGKGKRGKKSSTTPAHVGQKMVEAWGLEYSRYF